MCGGAIFQSELNNNKIYIIVRVCSFMSEITPFNIPQEYVWIPKRDSPESWRYELSFKDPQFKGFQLRRGVGEIDLSGEITFSFYNGIRSGDITPRRVSLELCWQDISTKENPYENENNLNVRLVKPGQAICCERVVLQPKYNIYPDFNQELYLRLKEEFDFDFFRVYLASLPSLAQHKGMDESRTSELEAMTKKAVELYSEADILEIERRATAFCYGTPN